MGDPEVQDARPGGSEDDVLRFDIPVDDVGGVDGGEGPGGARGEGVQGAAGKGAVHGQVLFEGEARGVGGGQPRGFGIGVGRKEGDEARSLDAGGELHLAAEAGPELGVLGVCGVDDLDRDAQPGRIEAGGEPCPCRPPRVGR